MSGLCREYRSSINVKMLEELQRTEAELRCQQKILLLTPFLVIGSTPDIHPTARKPPNLQCFLIYFPHCRDTRRTRGWTKLFSGVGGGGGGLFSSCSHWKPEFPGRRQRCVFLITDSVTSTSSITSSVTPPAGPSVVACVRTPTLPQPATVR